MGSNKGRKKALIVGVSDYEKLQPLTFCKNDAISIAEILSSLRYEVTEFSKLVGKVQWQDMRDAIIEYFNDPTLRREDTIIFYYSGHGVLDVDGDGYLATSQTDPLLPNRRGFSFDELTKAMKGSISSQIIAILDCCYSGSAKISKGSEEEVTKLGVSAVNRVSRTITSGEGVCLLASSQSYQEAYELEKQNHSLYTYFLLEGLKGNKEAANDEGYVTVDSLSNYIFDKITQLPENKKPRQRPLRKIEASGEIRLAFYPELANLRTGPLIQVEFSSIIEKGQDFLDKGDYQAALNYYEDITRNPSLAQAWDNKGIALQNLNEIEEAIKCFDICIGLDPTNPKGWEHKGVCLSNRGNSEEALICFTKSIVMTKSNDTDLDKCNRWFGKGLCLEKKGLQNDALYCYNKSLELYPKAEMALCKKGDILTNQKDYTEAEKCYDESLKIDQESPLALLGKGNLLQVQQKYSESIPYYERAIKCLSRSKVLINNPDAIHFSLASSLMGLKKYEESLESINEALRLNPNNSYYLSVKGLIFQVTQRNKEAVECYDAVLKLDPNNTDVIKRREMLLDTHKPDVNKENTDWSVFMNKHAYGIGYYDLGLVEAVKADHIVTIRKGRFNKVKFSLPIYLVERYDDVNIWFRISQEDSKRYQNFRG